LVGATDELSVGIPVDIGTTNAEGTATNFVRRDHVHAHPSGLGADLHHAQAHDHTETAVGKVARAGLEYPTTDVSFTYLLSIGKAEFGGERWNAGVVTVDAFEDRRVWSIAAVGRDWCDGINLNRFVDRVNHYHSIWNVGFAGRDHQIRKTVAGVHTTLAYEAVDLREHHIYHASLQMSGITLKSWRSEGVPNWATPTLTATDTAFASGRFGACFQGGLANSLLLSPVSSVPKPIAYFEVPVVGSGSYEDPFTPQMPELLETHPELGEVNLLALTTSALIKTDHETGKPKEYVAVVRILEQPDRPPYLRSTSTCLSALKEMAGVRELGREQAVKRALELDDLLTEEDLKDW